MTQERKGESLEEIIAKIENRLQPTKIGYLSGSFEKGEIPEGFLDKLKEIEANFVSYKGSMGQHICEYCFPDKNELQRKLDRVEVNYEDIKDALSGGEKVLHGKYIWPDMLTHYIKVHNYRPPQEFIDEIMGFDLTQPTMKERMAKFKLPKMILDNV